MAATRSIIRLALAATLWGMTGAVAQFIDAGASPAFSATARMLIGGIVLCCLAGRPALMASRGLPPATLALAAAAMAAFQWTLFEALAEGSALGVTIISVASAALAAEVGAMVASLVAFLITAPVAEGEHKRHGSTLTRAAAGIASAAAIMLAAAGTRTPPAAMTAAIASGVAYAVYASVASALEQHRQGIALACTGAALLLGGLALIPFAAAGSRHVMGSHAMPAAAMLGAGLTALPYWLFLSGMRGLGARTALAILGLEPCAAMGASVLLLDATINRAVIAAVSTLGAAMALNISLHHKERTAS